MKRFVRSDEVRMEREIFITFMSLNKFQDEKKSFIGVKIPNGVAKVNNTKPRKKGI